MVSQVKNLEKKSKVDGQIKQIKHKKLPKTSKVNKLSYE